MPHITHVLTPVEIECGVTFDAVVECRAKGLFIQDGTKFVLPENTSPALAGSAARLAFSRPAEFLGFNQLRHPVYGAAAG